MITDELSPADRADLYARLHSGNPGDLERYRRACEGATTILELGCGEGRVLRALAAPDRHLVGVDLDPGLLALARHRCGRARPRPASLRLIAGDMRTLALGRAFDRVLIPYSGIFCLADEAEVIAALSRAREHLAPGGEVIFDAYQVDAVHDELAGEAIVDGRRGERELRDRLHEQREPSKRAPGGPPRELAVGDPVLVATLDREGEVVAIQGSKVTVLIGGLRTTVALADLRQSAAAAEPEPPRTKIRRQQSAPIRTWAASTASRHFGAEPAVVERSVDNVVDLRGSRADEAIRALDRFIDQALLADQEVVLIQHGHGSGALRQSVREHLRTLGCVRELRPGLPREGGDGATIVWLDA
ncbi:MAG: Smr/MutS family protein [Myxococcales bacterium]|nr:Smr/MutS family protein [Myxococcales bacterium]